MGATWEAWLLATLLAGTVVAAWLGLTTWRASRGLRTRIRERLLPRMGESRTDLTAAADQDEPVTLRGRLRVTSEPVERFVDERPVAAAAAVRAPSLERLGAFDDEILDARQTKGLGLDVGGERVALFGRLRLLAGDETRPAATIADLDEALCERIDADLNDHLQETIALRSVPADAEVVVRGRLERAPAASQRSDYRSSPSKWTLVPAGEDEMLELAQLRPKVRPPIKLYLFPGLVAAALVLWQGPGAIDQLLGNVSDGAWESATECLDAYDAGNASFDDCLAKADGLAMTLVGVLPSYTEDAQNTRQRIRRRSARRLLDHATELAPQPQARTEAAERYLAIMGDDASDHLYDLFDAGAFAVVAERDDGALAFEAALALGDVDRATELAIALAEAPGTVMRVSQAIRIGAWLCLREQRDEGLAWLRARLDDVAVDYQRDLLLMTLAACGGDDLARRFIEPSTVEYIRSYDPSYQSDRRRAVFRTLWEARYPKSRHHVIAASYLGGKTAAPFADALAIAQPSMSERLSPRPRSWSWPIAAAHWDPDVVKIDVAPEPTELETAAERVEGLAESPPEMSDEHHWRLVLRPDDEAMRAPKPVLRHAAWTLWLEAGVEHLRRGNREAARSALTRADAIAVPEHRAMSAAAHLAAGDPAGAQKLLASSPANETFGETRRLLLLSQAAADQGHPNEAFDLAKRAHAASGATDRPDDPYSEAGGLQVVASHQLAAMALLVDRVDEALALLTEPRKALDEIGDLAKPAALLRLIKRGLPEDVPYWVSAPGLHVERWPWLAVTSGQLLARGKNIEVALDGAWSEKHRESPRITAWARWRAATLRGDEVGQKRWSERLATLDAVAANDASGVLARAAGL